MFNYDFEYGWNESCLILKGRLGKEDRIELKRIIDNCMNEASILKIDIKDVTNISSECRVIFYQLLQACGNDGKKLEIHGGFEEKAFCSGEEVAGERKIIHS